ncbi:hypothetical protein R3P38DRAFT_2881396 [Favolaschia claudopus]|uniref:Uncharacterized protein n=1 Tax=Favolaschia claudopus TaxID=2862362 RepID=A0AAW0D0G3_9AGAR
MRNQRADLPERDPQCGCSNAAWLHYIKGGMKESRVLRTQDSTMMSRCLLWAGLATIAAAQTLKLVTPVQTGGVTVLVSQTDSISALGVGADGMTTYLRVGAETLAVEISGTVTKTLLAAPIPYTETFLEDASKFVMGASDSGLSETCTFGADNQGACVVQFVSAGPSGTSTLTSTYSGPVVPWYTLNAAAAADSAPGESGSRTSTSPSSRGVSETGTSAASSPSPSTPNSASALTSGSLILPVFVTMLYLL